MLNILILFMIFAIAPAEVWAAEPAPIDIEAESLALDPETRTARFEGKVQLQQGNLSLSCDFLSATYDQAGAVVTIEAKGHVQVRQPDLQVTAGHAKYEKALGTLVLEGHPLLKRGDDRVEGERVTLWPETGRLEISHAKGRVRGPKLETALPSVKP